VFRAITKLWSRFRQKHPALAQFVMFFILSNGVTVLQLALMPAFRAAFATTSLVGINFQVFPVGTAADGVSRYFIFNYAAGPIAADGTGGGLAYFLAVEITLLIAQVINFFAQRNITFRSNSSPWWAAFWYLMAYVVITFAAGALQGLYKAPIYRQFMDVWKMGGTGETIADAITMIINAALSFWVFFPIFKVIFRQTPQSEANASSVASQAPGSQAR
jgi:putative flippase GtrA